MLPPEKDDYAGEAGARTQEPLFEAVEALRAVQAFAIGIAPGKRRSNAR
jgi:hypothetical protein